MSHTNHGNEQIINCIRTDLQAKGLSHSDEKKMLEQVNKIEQIYQTMCVRHSVMLLGPPGGGKSVAINTLADALEKYDGLETRKYFINPKSVNGQELWGSVNSASIWTDGLLTMLYRE